MIIRRLTVTLLCIFIAIGTIGGCGGGVDGDGECIFDILLLSNGADQNTADSFWLCRDQFDDEFAFSVWDDGSGISSDIFIFNWVQTSCDSISFTSALGTAEAINIMVGGGVLTFDQISNVEELDDLSVACVLIFL